MVMDRPTILLIGRNGQVGWELERALAPLGTVVAVARPEFDLREPATIRLIVAETRPNVIVNAAAYTAVDRAEEEADVAMAVNGTAVGIIGEEAKKAGAAVIHYSTDYVFDGRRTAPYLETDPVNPLNAYGRSKLAGERALLASGAAGLILRTGWVYGLRGGNFLLTIRRLLAERDSLRIVDDQTGSPTWSRLVAETTAQIIARTGRGLADYRGIYHLTCQGYATWCGFAREIASYNRGPAKQAAILPVTSAEYGAAAIRPACAVLDNGKLAAAFGLLLPDWRAALALAMAGERPNSEKSH
ncbi:MAG TPA: dTDP-4-dehydrorhamnose reductase [Negativicutes bacterium]|nr:dTDP-4-dehydrorhamnose reductase [Negativicutes bacterium]